MPTKTKSRPRTKIRSNKNGLGIAPSATALELKEPSAGYFVRNVEIPEFFGQQLAKGERMPLDKSAADSSPRLFYSHPHGEIWLGDSVEWLRSLDAGSVDLVFADPPYNIKKAEWD